MPYNQTKAKQARRRGTKRALKEAEAIRLRLLGLSFAEIASQLDYADESGAYRAVQRGLKHAVQGPATELREVEDRRLNLILRKTMEILLSKEKPSNDTILKTVDRIVKIIDQRCRLHGLHAPTKIAETDTAGNDLTTEQRQARLQIVVEEIGRQQIEKERLEKVAERLKVALPVVGGDGDSSNNSNGREKGNGKPKD